MWQVNTTQQQLEMFQGSKKKGKLTQSRYLHKYYHTLISIHRLKVMGDNLCWNGSGNFPPLYGKVQGMSYERLGWVLWFCKGFDCSFVIIRVTHLKY